MKHKRPERDQHKCRQLIFDKNIKVNSIEKEQYHQQIGWNKWTSNCRKKNLDTDLTLLKTKLQIYHEIKCTIKLPEDNLEETLGLVWQ